MVYVFSDGFKDYLDEKVAYFDYCSASNLNKSEVDAMLLNLRLKLGCYKL